MHCSPFVSLLVHDEMNDWPLPCWHQVGYQPKDWISVQLPHDGLIAATASAEACPSGCSGNSFIPVSGWLNACAPRRRGGRPCR